MDLYTPWSMPKRKNKAAEPRQSEPGVPVEPFLKFIADAARRDPKYGFAQFSRDNGFKLQRVFNWKSRGTIPRSVLGRVVKGMGTTYEAYLAQIEGGVQATLDVPLLISNYEALSPGLKEIVARQAAELRRYYEAIPPFLRKGLHKRPAGVSYEEWQKEVVADMARLLMGKNGEGGGAAS